MPIGYIVLVVETLIRVAVVPYLMMAGGVTIAVQLGYQVNQNFPLFMAVATMMGAPWLLKTGMELIVHQIMAAQQKAEYEAIMRDMKLGAFSSAGEQREGDGI